MFQRNRIKARFIGSTSCGFISGFTYEIKIYTDKKDKYVWVKDLHGYGICPYSSIDTLAKNWEIPTHKDFNKNLRICDYPPSNNLI